MAVATGLIKFDEILKRSLVELTRKKAHEGCCNTMPIHVWSIENEIIIIISKARSRPRL